MKRQQALISLVRFTNGFVAAQQIKPCMVLHKTTHAAWFYMFF
jgi:hypothetical protein